MAAASDAGMAGLSVTVREHLHAVPLQEYASICKAMASSMEQALKTVLQEVGPPAEQERDDDCAICLETLSGTEELWRCVCCRHRLHERCVKAWRQAGKNCPFCRHTLSASQDLSAFRTGRQLAQKAQTLFDATTSTTERAFLAQAAAESWRAAA